MHGRSLDTSFISTCRSQHRSFIIIIHPITKTAYRSYHPHIRFSSTIWLWHFTYSWENELYDWCLAASFWVDTYLFVVILTIQLATRVTFDCKANKDRIRRHVKKLRETPNFLHRSLYIVTSPTKFGNTFFIMVSLILQGDALRARNIIRWTFPDL